MAQAGGVAGVQIGEGRVEGVQVGGVVVGVGRVGLGQGGLDRLGGRLHAHRVEPEVRVEGRGGVVVVGGLGGALLVLLLHAVVVDQVDAPGQVHDRGAGDLGEGVVEGGLEAGDVQDQGGGGQGGDVLGGQLEVVGLDVGGGDAGDRDVLAADGLGQVLDGVEGRGHRQGAGGGRRRGRPGGAGGGRGGVRSGGQGGAGGQGAGECEGGDGGQVAARAGDQCAHGNHSQCRWRSRQTGRVTPASRSGGRADRVAARP